MGHSGGGHGERGSADVEKKNGKDNTVVLPF